jgi:hypothetical protein
MSWKGGYEEGIVRMAMDRDWAAGLGFIGIIYD